MYRSVSVLVIGKMMEKLGEIGQSDRGIEGERTVVIYTGMKRHVHGPEVVLIFVISNYLTKRYT